MNQFPGAVQYPVRWWGFPNVHSARRIKPTVLLVVHITGNSNLPSAIGEATYANRNGSGASFTFVTNRDGSIVQCLDPLTQTPWTNGDMNAPNTSIPTVREMVGSPYNPNEFCLAACENVGYEPANPISAAQIATLSRLVQWLASISGLPISRSTVIGHRDINSVTRHGCPTAGDLDALLNKIIAGAIGAPAPGGDVANAHPATLITKNGRVSFSSGTYNAFQYLGQNADGTPNLRRFSNLKLSGSGDVIARAHWEANKAEADCFLVVPWLYTNGWQDMVWFSKSPLAEPAYTDSTTPAADCTAAVAAATAPLNTQIAAARKALT